MRLSKSKLGYAIVTVAAFGAGSAQAAEKEMLEACTQYFIAANLAVFPGKINVDTPVDDHRPLPLSTQTRYAVAVKTVDAASGEQLAAGVCTVTRTGRVVSFKPTTAMSERLTARLAPETVARATVE